MSTTQGVTLVLPCLDEAESIEECVTEAREAMAASGEPFEVLVVDNGSTDGSDVLAAQAGARVVHEPVPGYGSALARGIAEATTDIVAMADADATYELSRLGDLVGPVRAGEADMVLGERLASANNESMPFLHRVVGTPVLSWLNRRAAPGLTITDSQSGFRAFRRAEVLALDLQGTGMEFASEMLIQAARAGFVIDQIPTEYRVRKGESKLSTFRDGLRHLQLIMLLAPQAVLKVPGVALLVAGVLATVLGVLAPEGLAVGDRRWQPVFLGTLLITAGTLGVLAGAALERFSPLAGRHGDPPRRDLRSVRNVAVVGGLSVLAGVTLDVALVFYDTVDAVTAGRRLALAGLATSLLIVGLILLVAALIGRLLLAQIDYLRSRPDVLHAEAEVPEEPTVAVDEPGTS